MPVQTESLPDIIKRLEDEELPRDEYSFVEPIAALGRTLHDRGEAISRELVAEEIAFSLHAHDHQAASSWGLYFGPFMSWSTNSGETIDSPPLSSITNDVLSHWQQRANECPHPVMRARYADLLWEIPKRLEEAKPDVAMARIAIDAYLEAVEEDRYEHSVSAVGKAKRALDLAISINDADRVDRARDTLISLENRVADDESLGLWGFSFDAFIEPPNRRVSISEAQRNKLIGDLEARLARLLIKEADQYHPVGAEAAAMRLANYYRRRGQLEDVLRVLRGYAEAVKRMRGTAPSMLVSHSLEQLYDQLMSFGLHDDAQALEEAIRVAGEQSMKDMKPISARVEVPQEKVEAYFDTLLEGDSNEVLQRLALHFIPKRDRLEAELRDLAEKAPLSYLLTRTIKDDDGRTVALVGPLQSDLEGQLINHISQGLQLGVPWLREVIVRGTDCGLLSAESVLKFVLQSPLFPAKRQPMLEMGINSWFKADSMIAIHVLVPQIEQGLRQLAIIMGAPIYAQRRGGGLHVRTLDDLLRDDAVCEVLGDSAVMYLRVLLTDPRGWNVRNSVCHGLASSNLLSAPVADRVVHAILLLGLIRLRSDQSGES